MKGQQQKTLTKIVSEKESSSSQVFDTEVRDNDIDKSESDEDFMKRFLKSQQ
jgi:hypothetical protein